MLEGVDDTCAAVNDAYFISLGTHCIFGGRAPEICGQGQRWGPKRCSATKVVYKLELVQLDSSSCHDTTFRFFGLRFLGLDLESMPCAIFDIRVKPEDEFAVTPIRVLETCFGYSPLY